MAIRKTVNGVVLVPERFRLVDSNLEHTATRYRIFADRARQQELIDTTQRTEAGKIAYSYTPGDLYDDMVVYFTTNMELTNTATSEVAWSGESPLTKITLRKEKFASTGIIATPDVTSNGDGRTGNFTISSSDFLRYDGIAAHESTDYKIVEETTGKVIVSFTDVKDVLQSFYVKEDLLEQNKIYRFMVRYKDAVGRWSNWGSCIYDTFNFLYALFPHDDYYVYDNTTLSISKVYDQAYLVNDNELVLELTKNDVDIGSQTYNSAYTFDASPHDPGDVIDGRIVYQDTLIRTITIYILANNDGSSTTTTTADPGGSTTTTTTADPSSTTTTTSSSSTTTTTTTTSAPVITYGFPWGITSISYDSVRSYPSMTFKWVNIAEPQPMSYSYYETGEYSPGSYTYLQGQVQTSSKGLVFQITTMSSSQDLSYERILECSSSVATRISAYTNTYTFIAVGYDDDHTLRKVTVRAKGGNMGVYANGTGSDGIDVFTCSATTIAAQGGWSRYRKVNNTIEVEKLVNGVYELVYTISSSGSITAH